MERPPSATRARVAALGLLLFVACFADVARGLWTPDEPREAGIARDMYLHPTIVPTLDGAPFYEKPPLYYWIVALTFAATGGPSAAAARAISGTAGFLTLLAVALWARRVRPGPLAAVAVVLLATSAEFVVSAHWVRIDALLMLFCTLAFWAAWERLAGGPRGWLVVFYGAIVLALWTKGLIGPVLVGAGLLAFAALARDRRALSRLSPALGAAIVAAAVATLALAIYAGGGSRALYAWGWVNHVERFVHPEATGHAQPWRYYLVALPLAVAPWLVPFADLFRPKSDFWRRGDGTPRLETFLLGAVAGPLLVLSLASTKRDVYLLPLMPPLAILMAAGIVHRFERSTGGAWERASAWIQAGLLSAFAVAPPIAAMIEGGRVAPLAALLLAVGIAAAVGLVVATARRAPRRAFGGAAVAAGVALAGVFLLAVPRIERDKDFAPFLASVDALLPPGQPVYAVGSDETVLGIVPFCTGRRVVPLRAADLARDPVDPAPRFVMLQSKGRERVPPEISTAYERVAGRAFGPDRRLSLWRRASDPATEQPR